MNVETRSERRTRSDRLVLTLFLLVLPAILTTSPLAAHGKGGRKISFPDVPGYRTLAVDLHTHSVFSDGSVWPDIRIQEAQRDGIDAISLTEHLEYQPHEDDIPHPDRNRAHELAVEIAEGSELIVIQGSEITRRMPPGHSNAIFIEDSNQLLVEDPMAVFQEAVDQGGFVFWNHPNWVGQREDGTARLEPVHLELIEKQLLHGIEVTNDLTYSSEALAIALEHDLTILGTSDIHGLVDWQYSVPEGGHRPVTLVFAEERSEAGIEEALRAGRTVAWMDDLLVGRREHVDALLGAVVEVAEATYPRGSVARVVLANRGSARLVLRRVGGRGFYSGGPTVILEPHSETTIQEAVTSRRERLEFEFEVVSALVEPTTHPVLKLATTVTWEEDSPDP